MKTTSLATLIVCLIFVGCTKPDSDTVVMNESPPGMEDDHSGHDDSAHAHPEHGPHGGELVELGKEAFHLELTHSDDGIAMYVLDGSATKSVTIEAEKLVVSLKHEGKVESFELPASPEDGEAEGKTSRFVSAQEELDEWLDAGAEGAVVIEIEGKSYTGKISHDHDHAGHDHAGHDH